MARTPQAIAGSAAPRSPNLVATVNGGPRVSILKLDLDPSTGELLLRIHTERPLEPEGSVISIDPGVGPIDVPAQFARAGGQLSALNGALQMYAAQSQPFLNSVKEPQAVTSDLPSASLPTGITSRGRSKENSRYSQCAQLAISASSSPSCSARI